MMTLSRRTFLRSSACGAAAASLTVPLLASAAEGDKNLIIVFAKGGWDVTYGFDPKLGFANIEGPEHDEGGDAEEEVSFGDLRFVCNDVKRPSVRAFFDTWADRCCVVNGIWVGSIAHQQCSIRIATGRRTEASPDLAAIVGYENGREVPIPYMNLGGGAFTGELAAYSGRTGQRNQLALLLDRNQRVRAPASSGLEYPLFVPEEADAAAVREYLQTRATRFSERRGTSGRNAALTADWFEATARAEALIEDGREFAQSLTLGTQLSAGAQASAAVDLLSSGLCRTVSMNSGLAWDSHDDITEQHAAYETLFTGLASLMQELETSGLADSTVVAVLSEMTRTPKRNGSGGKDHWPVTSAMLIGPGVAGGRTVGGTTETLDADLVDLETGDLWSGGTTLRYDHFAAGVLELLGVDPGAWFDGGEVYRGCRA
jgi:hypothetical protein